MTRDMTEAQFKAALARNGFKKIVNGLWVEHRDFPDTMFGLVYNPRNSRVARRVSVAKLIRDVERARKREAARQ